MHHHARAAALLIAGSLLAATSLMAGAAYAQSHQPRRDLIIECMACHGEDGIARDKDVPHLAGQNYAYLVKQLRDFQKGRRPHKEMRYMSRELSDGELDEIADFFSRLPRDPGRSTGWLSAPQR